jgi:hypothetical protein
MLVLDLPDRFGRTGQSVDSVADGLHAQREALLILVKALASIGLFIETSPGVYTPTDAGHLLRRSGGALRGTAEWLLSPVYQSSCDELLHSVRTGQASLQKVVEGSLFDWFESDRAAGDIFDGSMSEIDAHYIPSILEHYDFGAVQIVDVGGGRGELLAAILRKQSHARGLLLEQPRVLDQVASRLTAEFGERITCVPGDFRKEVPGGAEVYILKRILHDWPDDVALSILKNVCTAMEETSGTLLVIDAIADRAVQRDAWFDLHMLLTLGTRERSMVELRNLLGRSGLEVIETKAMVGGVSMLTAQLAHAEDSGG